MDAMWAAVMFDKETEYQRLQFIVDHQPLSSRVYSILSSDYGSVWARVSALMPQFGTEEAWSAEKVRAVWRKMVSSRLIPDVKLEQASSEKLENLFLDWAKSQESAEVMDKFLEWLYRKFPNQATMRESLS
jgi:hypothetical protein